MSDDPRTGTTLPAWHGRRAPPLRNSYDAWEIPAALATVNVVDTQEPTAGRKLRAWATVIVFAGACGLASVPWWI